MIEYIDALFSFDSYLGIALVLASASYGVTVFFGRHLNSETKENLTLWLWGEYESTWTHHFCNLFDTVFGERHLSWGCFFRSSIASIISVVLLYFLFSSILGVLGGRAVGDLDLIRAIAIGAAINILPDYVSLYETRWILKRFERVRSFSGQAGVLFVDLILSGIIIWLGISVFQYLIGGLSLTAVEVVALFSVYSVFFYSTFLTSVWAWFYCVSTWFMRLFSKGSLSRFLDVENNPVSSVALVISIVIFLVVAGLSPLLNSDKKNDISNLDDMLCEVFASDICAHVARISSDEADALIYLLRACEAGRVEYCPAKAAASIENLKENSLIWPLEGRIISNFGASKDGDINTGIDIAVDEGTPVQSVQDGVVIYADNNLVDYGFTILIRHEGGFVSVYAHNNRLLASRGDTVKAGDVIAESGMTGNAKLPMLHFELRSNAVPKNPLDFLKSHSGKPGASDNSKLEPQNKSVIPSFTGSKTKSKRNQEIQSTIQNNPVGRLRSIVAMPLFGPERKLIESSAEMPIYPASLVKLATLKVLFEAMEAGTFSLDTEFVVSENAQRQVPSKIGLRSDTRVRVEDLIQMITTKNGNDAAVVIAEGVSGSVEKFVIDMNTMARQLGLESTHFSNPTGLPGRDQYSTTADIARLVRSIRKRHPAMSKYFSIAKFTWGKATFHNHNLLLNSVEGVDGMLTGYTRRSGFNMAVTVARENGDYVIVVTGAKTGKQRNMLAADSIKQIYSE